MKLIVIDIQKGITDERLYDFAGFIKNVTRIIDAARKNGVEVIYVQHDDGPGTGFSIGDVDFDIADQVAPMPEEKIFVKEINSCFGNKELARYLEKQDDKTLMIVGLQTNFCIDASVKSAFERGYRVIIPEGTNSTFDNDYMDSATTYRYYNEMMWPKRFADCISLDEAIRMLENKIMEYIDIFTRDGQFTGVSRPKHDPKKKGEYYRHVLIIMKTADSPAPGEGEGQYIVQQRSLKAKYYAGKWDMTGGAVMAGETPKAAAIREVQEELNITIPANELKLGLETIVDWDDGTGLLVSVFMCRVAAPKDGFEFDTCEVNDVKVMPFHEFLHHVSDHNDEEFCNGIKEIEEKL